MAGQHLSSLPLPSSTRQKNANHSPQGPPLLSSLLSVILVGNLFLEPRHNSCTVKVQNTARDREGGWGREKGKKEGRKGEKQREEARPNPKLSGTDLPDGC